jgi:beta-phosphoglucomutase-like phosphatase (HAD superfamily)
VNFIIKWVFIDVGSTIVDESICEDIRVHETINQRNSPSKEEFIERMKYNARCNKDAYKTTLIDYGIEKYFDLIISSSDVGVSKPSLEIFELALNEASCTPNEAIMVGDRLDNDIIPAQIIGMKTVWIKQGYGSLGNIEKLEIKPDFIVDSLEELLELDFFVER